MNQYDIIKIDIKVFLYHNKKQKVKTMRTLDIESFTSISYLINYTKQEIKKRKRTKRQKEILQEIYKASEQIRRLLLQYEQDFFNK